MGAYDIAVPGTFTAGNTSDTLTLLFSATSFEGC